MSVISQSCFFNVLQSDSTSLPSGHLHLRQKGPEQTQSEKRKIC